MTRASHFVPSVLLSWLSSPPCTKLSLFQPRHRQQLHPNLHSCPSKGNLAFPCSSLHQNDGFRIALFLNSQGSLILGFWWVQGAGHPVSSFPCCHTDACGTLHVVRVLFSTAPSGRLSPATPLGWLCPDRSPSHLKQDHSSQLHCPVQLWAISTCCCALLSEGL